MEQPHSLLAALVPPLVVAATVVIIFAIISHTGSARREVDQQTCACECWDGAYKHDHRAEDYYRDVYFNLTARAACLLVAAVVLADAALSGVRAVVATARARALRWRLLPVAAAQAYPLFYSAWSLFNYVNDGNPSMFWSQCYFSAAELAEAACALALRDARVGATERPRALGALAVLAVAQLAGCAADAARESASAARDAALMAGDLAYLVFALSLHFSGATPPAASPPSAAPPPPRRRWRSATAAAAAGVALATAASRATAALPPPEWLRYTGVAPTCDADDGLCSARTRRASVRELELMLQYSEKRNYALLDDCNVSVVMVYELRASLEAERERAAKLGVRLAQCSEAVALGRVVFPGA